MTTNIERAFFAELAADRFTKAAYCGRHYHSLAAGERQEAVVDLMTNLLHLAKREGQDTEQLMRCATHHFEEEIEEE